MEEENKLRQVFICMKREEDVRQSNIVSFEQSIYVVLLLHTLQTVHTLSGREHNTLMKTRNTQENSGKQHQGRTEVRSGKGFVPLKSQYSSIHCSLIYLTE